MGCLVHSSSSTEQGSKTSKQVPTEAVPPTPTHTVSQQHEVALLLPGTAPQHLGPLGVPAGDPMGLWL